MSKQKAHQKLNQLTAVLMMAAAAALAAPAVQAGAGPSGPGYTYEVPGQLGAVAVNPYKIAPLTAVIYNGGYVLFQCASSRNKTDRKSPTKWATTRRRPMAAFRFLGFMRTGVIPWKWSMTAGKAIR